MDWLKEFQCCVCREQKNTYDYVHLDESKFYDAVETVEELRSLDLASSFAVRSKWDADIALMERGVKLLFSNALVDAEDTFEKGIEEPRSADVLAEGEHDLRAEFAFNWALASMIRGIASLADNQFDECLSRIWQADGIAKRAPDSKWIGHQIIRGCCFALAGVILLLKKSFVQGVVALARSWSFLQAAEHFLSATDSGDSTLQDKADLVIVRSAALFICGTVGLVLSLLPASIAGAAQVLVGISVKRDLAVKRLEQCWAERGLLAPWACAVALAYHLDIRYFLGEDALDADLNRCDAMLMWALPRHPGSIVFGLMEANLESIRRQNDLALKRISSCMEYLQEAPALELVVHTQCAKFSILQLRWADAAAAFDHAANLHIHAGRRSLVPCLSFASALCWFQVGHREVSHERLRRVDEYSKMPKKNWHPEDQISFRKASAYRSQHFASIEWTKLASVLDILELLELKLHALRRAPPEFTKALSSLLDIRPDPLGPLFGEIEARRLRFEGELLRLHGESANALRRLEAAEAHIKKLSKTENVELAKDGTEALVQYSLAEIHTASGNLDAAKAACKKMSKTAGKAQYRRVLEFKAYNLGQRLDKLTHLTG